MHIPKAYRAFFTDVLRTLPRGKNKLEHAMELISWYKGLEQKYQ
ncbi:MAG: hypothetical protein Q8R18_03030 [bacterium]|nr:hypothetical protein [bacterium]